MLCLTFSRPSLASQQLASRLKHVAESQQKCAFQWHRSRDLVGGNATLAVFRVLSNSLAHPAATVAVLHRNAAAMLSSCSCLCILPLSASGVFPIIKMQSLGWSCSPIALQLGHACSALSCCAAQARAFRLCCAGNLYTPSALVALFSWKHVAALWLWSVVVHKLIL